MFLNNDFYSSTSIGYHNYHHAYPNDYQASELGHGMNITKHFIDSMAKIGQAYNLNTATQAMVNFAKNKTSMAINGKSI